MNQRTLSHLAITGTTMALVLALMRVASVFSLSEPVHNVTSGWEQESLHSLWRWANGLPVYLDTKKLPFSSAYYNWLFYELYGGGIKGALSLFSLTDAWLPTIGRAMTFAGAAIGTCISYQAFLQCVGPSPHIKTETRRIAASLAVFTFFGPLIGFWVFSVRPDIWAMTFEALAVLLFWRNFKTAPVQAVLLCAVACYAAWAFKHNYIFSAATVGLWLALQRHWRPFFVFSGVLGSAYGITLIIGDSEFISSLFLTGELGFNVRLGVKNIINFALKSSPGLAVLGALLAGGTFSKEFRELIKTDPAIHFALIGLAISMLIMVPGSSKVGAAENYFFVPSLFMGLLGIIGIARFTGITAHSNGLPPRLFYGILSLGWVAGIIALLFVFSGQRGVISISSYAESYEQLKLCIKPLPQPYLVDEYYLSLPWINLSRPIVYPGYNYAFQRAKGSSFERGGVGGMISRGEFKALVLKEKAHGFDGGNLDKYQLSDDCGWLKTYLLKPSTK